MTMADLYYGIAAWNEENRIGKCLESLAVQDIDGAEIETIVCLNGCNDRTGEIVLASQKRYPHLNMKIAHSKKGKVFAQNEIVRQISEDRKPVAFVDADVHLDPSAISILYQELERLNDLKAVGGWPIPYRPSGLSLWESFLYEVLHARALFPQVEVSVHDVSDYKPFVNTSPQPAVSFDFERRAKIYFHGRLFMLRNKAIFGMPEDDNVADDSFLPNMINTLYGHGSIRTRYDALAYYEPYLSLGDHFMTYRRVYAQLRYLDDKFGEFAEARKMEQTRLDWDYIQSLGTTNMLRFIAYSLIRKSEQTAYRFLSEKSAAELWK